MLLAYRLLRFRFIAEGVYLLRYSKDPSYTLVISGVFVWIQIVRFLPAKNVRGGSVGELAQ
jgi:hypothetical protein